MTNDQYTLDNSLFSQLLSPTTRGIRYEVPLYQRGYVWKEEQWGVLLEDLKRTNIEQVFMGVIICVEANKGNPPVIVREIVDGQQRMTTLFLLLLALWKKLGEKTVAELTPDNNSPYIDGPVQVIPLLKSMLYQSDDLTLRLVPAKINRNQNDMYEIVRSLDDYAEIAKNPIRYLNNLQKMHGSKIAKLNSTVLNPVSGSQNRSIRKCFEYFYNNIPDSIDDLVTLFRRCEQLRFVIIISRDRANGYYLFQVLNDRGVDLSEMDIIKSYIFGELSNKLKLDDSEMDNRHNEWIELDSWLDTKTVRERFFRHLFNTSFRFIYNKNATQRSTLIQDYDSLVKDIVSKNHNNAIKTFFNQIIDSGREYSLFLNPVSTNGNGISLKADVLNRLHDLKEIEASTANMLLLRIHLWIKEGKLQQDDDKYIELLNFLCSFYIRRNITGFPSTNKLDPFMVSLVDSLNKDSNILLNNKIDWDKLIAVVTNKFIKELNPISWVEFSNQLQLIDMYKQYRKILMVLFIRIEETRDQYKRLGSLRHIQLSIDHIYPQTPQAGHDKWGEEVGYLGNLTLVHLRVNSAFSNSEFTVKRDFRDDGGTRVGYAAEQFYLDTLQFGADNYGLSSAHTWDRHHVTLRTTAIINYLFKCSILSLPGEVS